jgi:hypothetical protein
MVEFSRYAQLGTLALDGMPAVRTVNMRGVVADAATGRGSLRFSTDARSSKIHEFVASAQASKRAQAELCWFFPVTREQYRIRCDVALTFSSNCNSSGAVAARSVSSLVRTDDSSLASHLSFWQSHVPNARGMFEIAPPGTLKRREEQGDLDRFEPQPIGDAAPSANFVTVTLLPIRCDYLKLPRPEEDTRGKITRVQHHESNLQPTRQQQRWLHTRDEQTGEWKAVELNP